MPLSIQDLSVHDKIKTLIAEGSQYMTHFQAESEVCIALISENYPKQTVRDILESGSPVGATFRQFKTSGYRCPPGCQCIKELGEQPDNDAYFNALHTYCLKSVKSIADQEITSMEEELGFIVDKVTIFESTESTVRFDVTRDGKQASFMIEPEKMYLPSEFAKTVLGRIQVLVNVPARKRWPLLVKKWLDMSERVVMKEQTTYGIICTQLSEFIRTCGVESTPEEGINDIDKGNAIVCDGPNGGWILCLKTVHFLDFLDRNKIKLSKNSILSFFMRHGWYNRKLGHRRTRLWTRRFNENPLSETCNLEEVLMMEKDNQSTDEPTA